MNPIRLIRLVVAAAVAAIVIPPLSLPAQSRSAPPRTTSFTVVEASIADLQNAL
jgi:hypothetical protein